MKKTTIARLYMLVTAFVLMLAVSASAQGILNDTWFQVKVKTKTLWWKDAAIPIESRADSFTAYMRLVWQSENTGVQDYLCHLWTQDETGAWVNRSNPTLRLYNEGEKLSLVPSASMVWYIGENDRYTTEANIRVKISTDSSGAFKKASLDSLGCAVALAFPAGLGDAYGGCTMKGKSLKESPIF